MICSECLNRVVEGKGNKQREEELQRLIGDYLSAGIRLKLIDWYHEAHLKKMKKALSTLTVAEFQEVLSRL